MLFEDLSELGSNLADGFKMDDVTALLQEDRRLIGDREKKLLEYIKNYLNLARQGYYLYSENIFPTDDITKVLNAFQNIFHVFFNTQNVLMDDFLNELDRVEHEIEAVEDFIDPTEMENSLNLFSSISLRLLDENQK